MYLCNNPGTFTNLFDTFKPSITLKAGDTASYLPDVGWTAAQRAKKPYQVMVPSLYRPNLFPTLTKYLDPCRSDVQYQPGFSNTLRRRAAFPGKEAGMQITAAQLNMNFIMEERERELQGEMFRWFDLKRWGVLVERVKLYNPDAQAITASKHEMRPIPQDQIDRTAGGVSAFPKDPTY